MVQYYGPIHRIYSEHDGTGRAGGCNVCADVHGQWRRRNYKPVAGHQSRWTLFFSETHIQIKIEILYNGEPIYVNI